MTKKELSQLYYLNREIGQLEQHKREIQHQIDSIGKAADTVKGSAASFPFMLRSILIEGTDAQSSERALKLREELIDIKRLIERRSKQCTCEYNRLMHYINEIDDSLTRQILSLRFVNGLSWNQVASCIGGGNTEGSVKKSCYRFMQKK